MKLYQRIISVASATLLATTCMAGLAACKKKGGDPETRRLVMSISQPDGVFNPFFSTSAYDGSIIGMTQIGMLTTNKDGELVWGDDEACVVKDVHYETTGDADAGTQKTKYEFIIKKGIKFSDGVELTIKDVLFNLYVYLDPVYTGSSTIYSTDIVGLNAYRYQDPDLADDDADTVASYEQRYQSEAVERMENLADYVLAMNGICTQTSDHTRPNKDSYTAAQKAQHEADYAYVAQTFRKELESDWNSTVDSMDSYKDWGGNWTPWLVYLLNDGMMSELYAKDASGKIIKDSNGNPSLDSATAATYQQYLNDYKADHPNLSASDAEKAFAIDTVYDSYFPDTDLMQTNHERLELVLFGWMTGEDVRTQFAAEAKSADFDSGDGVKAVPTISGIDGTTKRSTDFSGKDLGSEHEVLTITINGIDPKAIWNFAFTVAPMHYYSGTYEGVNYIENFNQATGNFGLKSDINFFNEVINASNKVGLPVGAGTYMASNANGQPAKSSDEFFNLNWIYYERNPYFYTVFKNGSDKDYNAKIKYVGYKVVDQDQIINSLRTGEIDFGDPNATTENIDAANKEGFEHVEIDTAGYGYVGINPRWVPDINVRRAIMMAMNTAPIFNNYYKNGLASRIYRPMSKTSWAYPTTVTKDFVLPANSSVTGQNIDYGYKNDGFTADEINALLDAAGYTSRDASGVRFKEVNGWTSKSGSSTDSLNYTLTIAGGSTDHPAYEMFVNAAKLLNTYCGFNVKVVQSQTALSDLTTGKLAIWAAAWGSAIDPDMYQVYHKDSKATSTRNWGYEQIFSTNGASVYPVERQIIEELSLLIEQARETNDEEERAPIYHQALDLVMELAVEMPTYQRKDMTAYQKGLFNEDTLQTGDDLTSFNGVLARIWEVNYR